MRGLRHSRWQLIALLCLLGGIGGCLLLAGTGHAAQRLGGPQLLRLALGDAANDGSVRLTLTQGQGKRRLSYVDEVGPLEGRQQIKGFGGGRAEIVVSGQTAYLSGNTQALTRYFKFSEGDAAVVGPQWISIPSTDAYYKGVAQDVTMRTLAPDIAPAGVVTRGRQVTIDGQAAIPLTGRIPGLKPGVANTDTLYVTATQHPLPLLFAMEMPRRGHPPYLDTGHFSQWRQPVVIDAPAPALPIAEVPRLVEEFTPLLIPGAPGYFTFTGPHGYPGPVGRPWGAPCKPVLFGVSAAVPNAMYSQIAAVIHEAREQGLDVAIESRQFKWRPNALFYRDGETRRTTEIVSIFADDGPVPDVTGYKRPQDSQLSWDTRVDADGRHEDLTNVQGTLWMRVVRRDPETLRRAIRQLIALTQGIGDATDPASSGIANWSPIDGFTPQDIAAMLKMSGCVASAPTSVDA